MYYVLSEEKQGHNIRKEFVCDALKDLNNITNCSFGDLAIIVYPAGVFLRNSKEQWLEL